MDDMSDFVESSGLYSYTSISYLSAVTMSSMQASKLLTASLELN